MITITNTTIGQLKYPYVAKLSDDKHTTIVWFTSLNTGICLWSTDQTNITYEVEYNWEEHKFSQCEITLR